MKATFDEPAAASQRVGSVNRRAASVHLSQSVHVVHLTSSSTVRQSPSWPFVSAYCN